MANEYGWAEVRVRDFGHFVDLTSDLTPSSDHYHWFRGQSNAKWALEPSLTRALKGADVSADAAASIEEDAWKAFRSQAHLFVSPTLLDKVHTTPCWWALMQHHGAPTRLLDWSSSPYVAAYFACLSEPGESAAIWCFCQQTLREQFEAREGWPPDFADPSALTWFEQKLKDLRGEPLVMPLEFGYPSSQRIAAQQGRFTMCFHAGHKHDCVIQSVGPQHVRRFIIPAKKKLDFLLRLRDMNITGANLFPGVDGLGRSVTELIALRAHEYSRAAPASQYGG